MRVFDSFATATYFSLTSFTTLGAADLTLSDGIERTVALSDEGVIDLQEIAPGTVTVKVPGRTPEADNKDSEA